MNKQEKSWAAGAIMLGVCLGILGNLVANFFDRFFIKFGIWYDLSVVAVFFFTVVFLIRGFEKIIEGKN